MTDGWVQWETRYFGGGEWPVYLTVHKACGALIADREQHERVCTAPPWAPMPPERTIQDFHADGTIERRTP